MVDEDGVMILPPETKCYAVRCIETNKIVRNPSTRSKFFTRIANARYLRDLMNKECVNKFTYYVIEFRETERIVDENF